MPEIQRLNVNSSDHPSQPQMGVYILRNCISKQRYASFERWRFELSKGKEEYILVHFNNLHITFTVLSIFLSGYHLYTNNWIASNFIALSFSFNAISFLKLDTFFTGIILLSGLFIYDIYWVFYSSKTFGQSVMVGMSTCFYAPKSNLPFRLGRRRYKLRSTNQNRIPQIRLPQHERFHHARSRRYCYSWSFHLAGVTL